MARRVMIPDNYIKRVIQFARQGYTDIDFPIYDTDWDSDAYLTVSGQNSNNSVSLTDDFLRAVEADADWDLKARKDGKTTKTLKARDLWEQIGHAAWASADPGLHYNTTMNDWHTCPAGGRIRASNPCSEYMFLDDTACNLASANLLQFYDRDAKAFDVDVVRACLPPVDGGARNLRDDGAVPVEGNRRTLLRIPHARSRLRQYRRPAHDHGPRLRFRCGPRARRRAHRHHDRRVLCDLRRDGGRTRAVPELFQERQAHAARHPQPSPRGAWRVGGL